MSSLSLGHYLGQTSPWWSFGTGGVRKGEDSLGLSTLPLLDKVFFCSQLSPGGPRIGARLLEPDGRDREDLR